MSFSIKLNKFLYVRHPRCYVGTANYIYPMSITYIDSVKDYSNKTPK